MSDCPVHLHGPRFQTDPAGLYQEMRAGHGPVVPVLMEGDVPAWLVIGYRELHQVMSDPSVFARSSRRWNAWDRVPEDWPLAPLVMQIPSVLYSEGEEHRRRSGAISAALAGADSHELRTVTMKLADRLVDEFCTLADVDLRSAYTARLPALVLSWLYGLEGERGDNIASLMTTMIDGGPEAMNAQRSLMATVAEFVVERRENPGHDMVSRLIAHPAGYTDEELVPELIVVLGAGNETTGEWLGNALRLMLTDDGFAASIAGARRSAREALNEVLWEDTPTQVHAARYAAHDVELGGRIIRKGDMVLLGLAGANHDQRVHQGVGAAAQPGNHAHLSFSHGAHSCPYPAQEIAEIIAVTGVEVLMDRLPDLELAIPAEELRWRPSPWVRGVASLPVTFSPALLLGDT